ncbi:MAG: hypothetical protein ABL961_11720 [Vicinamibacterales bacterium]
MAKRLKPKGVFWLDGPEAQVLWGRFEKDLAELAREFNIALDRGDSIEHAGRHLMKHICQLVCVRYKQLGQVLRQPSKKGRPKRLSIPRRRGRPGRPDGGGKELLTLVEDKRLEAMSAGRRRVSDRVMLAELLYQHAPKADRTAMDRWLQRYKSDETLTPESAIVGAAEAVVGPHFRYLRQRLARTRRSTRHA